MFQRLLPIFALAAHISLWAIASMTLGKLTVPFPTHFALDGTPDAWSSAAWYLFPLIGLLTTLLLGISIPLSRHLAATHPTWLNIPRKRDWLKLPLEHRLRALRAMDGLLIGTALFVNLLMISIVLDSYAIAHQLQMTHSLSKLVLVLVVLAVWLVLSIFRVRAAVSDEIRLARLAASPPTEPSAS